MAQPKKVVINKGKPIVPTPPAQKVEVEEFPPTDKMFPLPTQTPSNSTPPLLSLSPMRQAQKEVLWLYLSNRREFSQDFRELHTKKTTIMDGTALATLSAKGLWGDRVYELLDDLEKEGKIHTTGTTSGVLVEVLDIPNHGFSERVAGTEVRELASNQP